MKELIKGLKDKISGFENKHRILSYVIFAAVLSFFTVIFSSSIASFIYPHMRGDDFTNDPQFFYLTGQMIKNGAKPYIDINDHKGLYVFVYELIAVSLGGRFGLFLLEFITTGVSLFFFQLIFDELKVERRTAIIMILIYVAAMAGFMQYNNTEEIEIIWLFPAMYFYFRGIMRKSDKDLMIGNILWGVQAGVTFNIRASDILFAFGAVCFYAYYALSKKKYLLCLRDAGLFLAAFALSCGPAYVYAYSQGFLREMFDSAILANIAYTSGTTSEYARDCAFLIIIFLVGFAYIHLWLIHKMKKEEWIFFIVNFVIIGLYQFLIAKFPHYWIMCFPALFVYLGRAVSLFGLKKHRIIHKGLSYFAVVAFLAASIFQISMYYGTMYEKDVSTSSYVKANISEEDRKNHTIMVDCASGNYIACGIDPHHKDFVMQTWHSHFEEGVLEGLFEYIDSPECKYVVMNETSQGQIRSFVETRFDLIGSKYDNPYCDIYIKI